MSLGGPGAGEGGSYIYIGIYSFYICLYLKNRFLYDYIFLYVYLRSSFARRLVRLEQLAALPAFYRPRSTREARERPSPHGCSWGEGMGKTSSRFPEPFPLAHPSPGSSRRAGHSLPRSGPCRGAIYGGLLPAGGSLIRQRFPCPNRKQMALDDPSTGIFFIQAGLKLWEIYCNSAEP